MGLGVGHETLQPAFVLCSKFALEISTAGHFFLYIVLYALFNDHLRKMRGHTGITVLYVDTVFIILDHASSEGGKCLSQFMGLSVYVPPLVRNGAFYFLENGTSIVLIAERLARKFFLFNSNFSGGTSGLGGRTPQAGSTVLLQIQGVPSANHQPPANRTSLWN
jgi:hypothetical protein